MLQNAVKCYKIVLIPIPLILIYIFKKLSIDDYLKTSMSLLIGGIGFYWFIERVIGIIS